VISDRVRLKWLVVTLLLLQLLGFIGIANLSLLPWRVVGIIGLGTSGGFFATLTTIALPRLFGRAYLGAIGGMQMTSLVIGSAVGPSLLALFKDSFGSYQSGLYVCSLMIPLALGLTLLARE
jgi:cyanate permease